MSRAHARAELVADLKKIAHALAATRGAPQRERTLRRGREPAAPRTARRASRAE